MSAAKLELDGIGSGSASRRRRSAEERRLIVEETLEAGSSVARVEKLQRMLFGSKSEKVLRQIEQLELQLEELQTASALEESTAITPAVRPVAAKPFRRPPHQPH